MDEEDEDEAELLFCMFFFFLFFVYYYYFFLYSKAFFIEKHKTIFFSSLINTVINIYFKITKTTMTARSIQSNARSIQKEGWALYREPDSLLFAFPDIYRLPIPTEYCKYANFLRSVYDNRMRLAYPELKLRALVNNFDSIAVLEAELLQAISQFQAKYGYTPPSLDKQCQVPARKYQAFLLKDNSRLAQYLLRKEDLPSDATAVGGAVSEYREYLINLYQSWSEPLVVTGYRLADILSPNTSMEVLQAHLVTLAAYYQSKWNAYLLAPKIYIDPLSDNLHVWNEFFLAYVRSVYSLPSDNNTSLQLPYRQNNNGSRRSRRNNDATLLLPFAILYGD